MNGRIRRQWHWVLLGAVCAVVLKAITVPGADLSDGQRLFLAGNYTGCVALARQVLKSPVESEDWQLLLIQSLLMTGRYPEALQATTNALSQDYRSVRLRWLAREVYRRNGQPDTAAAIVREVIQKVETQPMFYRDAASLLVVGQAALLEGADPKRVLDKLFDTAKQVEPSLRDTYLGSGEIALEKHDFALAAKSFQEGLKHLPDDPDLHFGLARAFAPSDPALASAALEAALKGNSNHVGCLLLLVDRSIDGEDYEAADKLLDRVNAINPWHPDAWSYRAVLAQLRNQSQAAETARQTALKYWKTDPRVEHLIGRKLSQKYRFEEGAAHQSQALRWDKDYLPSKAQLAQDLLRLGDETGGWRLAEEVQRQDGYDVEAFNLATLHDTMSKFVTLTNGDFLVRMGAHEAALYGPRVLELLGQARSNLCAKYGIQVKRPTIVEVFPEQKDFAVRTFGMPGNPGYLGVCFGTVITANSPAFHPGHPVNWQAVLWHEFCHVVTLQLTHNKMPRWLSEGISVYEEMQANSTWGQRMNPQYREMILGDELTPVSKLSAAFISPRSEIHLQFAYYESSLVVEFLARKFGQDALKAILNDLGQGAEINSAIEKHTAPMATLEKDFTAFARQRAEQLAPGLDWEKPGLGILAAMGRGPERSVPITERVSSTNSVSTNAPPPVPSTATETDSWAAWAKKHPTNFWVMTQLAQQFVDDQKWAEAKPVLQRLVNLYPDSTGSESAYRLLAAAHRALGETNAERQVLANFAAEDDEATDVYARLMEIGVANQDWQSVATNAQRYLAVDPLVAPPYRFEAQASEKTGDTRQAIEAYRALLQLDPPDPAEMHFRLAKLLHQVGDPLAKRQVLQALEEAPRYRDALHLLLEIETKLHAPGPSEARQ